MDKLLFRIILAIVFGYIGFRIGRWIDTQRPKPINPDDFQKPKGKWGD